MFTHICNQVISDIGRNYIFQSFVQHSYVIQIMYGRKLEITIHLRVIEHKKEAIFKGMMLGRVLELESTICYICHTTVINISCENRVRQ